MMVSVIAALGAVCAAEAADEIVWRDASALTVEHREVATGRASAGRERRRQGPARTGPCPSIQKRGGL